MMIQNKIPYLSLILILLFCVSTSGLLNAQDKISNEVFEFEYVDFELVTNEELLKINNTKGKAGWNKFIAGLMSNGRFIGFQVFDVLIGCKDINECFDLFINAGTKKALKQKGIRLLDAGIVNEKNAVFISSKNLNETGYFHKFSIMTNSGFVAIEIESDKPLVKKESLSLLDNLQIKSEYKGFPH